jgi:putative flippase GtrA
MALDALTQQAITHTRHCLTGCAIGEILGMAIGQNWANILQTALGIILAFFFGYLLTFSGARRKGMDAKKAFRLALAVDTISITSMVIVDNTLEWLIPGAINAQLHNILFWWSEAIALGVAFLLTVPVNRLVIARGGHNHHH